jgi:predicted  nucleic acid-binding Zn-ribbon protein
MENLKEKKAQLKSKLDRLEQWHTKQFSQYISKESDYQESARQIREVYSELFKVCDELGEHIPVRF